MEANHQYTQVNITINNLKLDKSRLETEISSLDQKLEETSTARRSAEERSERLQTELHKVTEQLKSEQESVALLEVSRKQLEITIREINIRMEEIESTKDGKKIIVRLQTQVFCQHTHCFNHQHCLHAHIPGSRNSDLLFSSSTLPSIIEYF